MAMASPALYYKMDETSGTNIVDSSVNGNDGAITGTYTLGIAALDGLGGTAIKFTDAAVTPGSTTGIPTGGTDGFAVEFLIKLFSADTASNGYILTRGNTGDVVFNYGGTNRIGIFKNSGDGGSVATDAFGPTVPRDDKWHHIVIGWNPDNSRYEAYMDGVFNSSYVQTAPTLSANIVIGRAGSALFLGGLDQFALYNYFPSAGDIDERAKFLFGVLSYFGVIRDKNAALAVGRGVRKIREEDQVCSGYGESNATGEYLLSVVRAATGIVTAASASVITDSVQAWTVDQFATHYGVRMTSGAQAGEWRRIASNTATALTLASALPGTTAINDTFEIAALHTLVFSGESDRNALVYSGLMPKEPPA